MSLKGAYKQKYEEWLGINREQWAQLAHFGVADGTELALDYTYMAKDEGAANSLSKALKADLGYDSTVDFLPEDGQENPAAWIVLGTTPQVASSLDFLDGWIETLIRLGAEHECMFESWGTYPPQAEPSLVIGSRGEQKSDQFPHTLTARIPGHIEPIDRGERYEDPLNEKLQEAGLGEVTGGGSQLDDSFAIQGVDLDVSVSDIDAALSIVKKVLEECGAPKGSKLMFERDGSQQTVDFGTTEGVALCLDAKLPEALWETHAQEVYPKIEEILTAANAGQIHGSRATEESTEVYIYGPSRDAIVAALKQFRETFPLCERSTVRKLE